MRDKGPSRAKHGEEGNSYAAMCVVVALEMQHVFIPQRGTIMWMGGHGGCYGPQHSEMPPPDIDFLLKGSTTSDKIKGKAIAEVPCNLKVSHMQMGNMGLVSLFIRKIKYPNGIFHILLLEDYLIACKSGHLRPFILILKPKILIFQDLTFKKLWGIKTCFCLSWTKPP